MKPTEFCYICRRALAPREEMIRHLGDQEHKYKARQLKSGKSGGPKKQTPQPGGAEAL